MRGYCLLVVLFTFGLVKSLDILELNHILSFDDDVVKDKTNETTVEFNDEVEVNETTIKEDKLDFNDEIDVNETGDETDILSKYIIGGENVVKGKYPHMVSLFFPSRFPFNPHCGGSLIASRFVLTAAHCLFKPPLFVEIGRTDLSSQEQKTELIFVKGIHIHPQFNGLGNDIGIIELKRPSQAKPISLPTSELKPKAEVSVVGFGRIVPNMKWNSRSPFLKEAVVTTMQTPACEKLWANYIKNSLRIRGSEKTRILKELTKILKGAICTEGIKNKGVCKGDSGGPLLTRTHGSNTIHGITSFGHTSCKSEVAPSVFTSVLKHKDWIELVISMSSTKSTFSWLSFYSGTEGAVNVDIETQSIFGYSLGKIGIAGATVIVLFAIPRISNFLKQDTLDTGKNMKEKKVKLVKPAEAEIQEAKEKLELKQAGEEKDKSV